MNSTTINQQEPSGETPLRSKVVRGLRWEMLGQLTMYGWRFGSNIILTRLLVAEAFGVMGIANVFILLLTLLSDVGLRGSVIHHERGEDKDFLNTVWTVGVLRGFILWALVCLGTVPFARFYEMPQLTWVLPLIGFQAVIRGFASTSVLSASRRIDNEWIVKVNCGSAIVGTTGTVIMALIIQDVLALALGWWITAVAYTVMSYMKPGLEMNRFCWDRDAVRSLSGFGRWAMASSGMTLIQQQGDRLLLGKITSAGNLGYYVVGANLAMLPLQMFTRINGGVLQPVYSQLRTDKPERIRKKIRKMRLGIVVAFTPALSLLVLLSQPIVDLLYKPDYARAGWFCGLATLAVLVRVASDMGPIFPAHGDSRSHFSIMSVRTICLVIAMAAGYYIGAQHGRGVDGVLFGVIVAPIMAYPYQAWMYRKLNAWFPEVDIIGLGPAILLLAMMLTK